MLKLTKTTTFLLYTSFLLSSLSCQNEYPELGDGLFAEFVTSKDTMVVALFYEKTPQKEAAAVKSDLASSLDTINGINTFIGEIPLDAGAIKDIAFQLKNEKAPFFGVIGSQVSGKVTLTVAISDDLVSGKDLHAGNIVRNLAKHIQGGGGGQPFFATAGGKNPDGLGAAFEEAKGLL